MTVLELKRYLESVPDDAVVVVRNANTLNVFEKANAHLEYLPGKNAGSRYIYIDQRAGIRFPALVVD